MTMETERFIVTNMKCQGCVNMVKTGLSLMDGVSEVYIDLSKSEVTINYSTEKVSHADLVKKMELLGYPVKQ
jgi:copper chaperone CopZ